MAAPAAIDEERGGLLAELTDGFKALMQKADELVGANQQLGERLHALQTELRNQHTPNHTSASSVGDVADRLPISPASTWRDDPTISKGIQAWKLLRIATVPAVPLRSTEGGDTSRKSTRNPPSIRIQALEKDFTTAGPKGTLKCPFSKRGALQCGSPHRLHDGSSGGSGHKTGGSIAASPDPIAREFHADVQDDDAEASAAGPPKCPIRFIDMHTPEEVAQYVEKHKHEIPRSHEVCVKRYQANEASIRSLDAKYGSLVKMIQGLSEKHKSLLPTNAEADADAEADANADIDGHAHGQSKEKVAKWASDVAQEEAVSHEQEPRPKTDTKGECGSQCHSNHIEKEHAHSHSIDVHHAPDVNHDDDADADDERTGHFERPLEEVRLGESPSRPWGIRVPLEAYDTAASSVRNRRDGSAAPHTGHSASSSVVAAPANVPVHENGRAGASRNGNGTDERTGAPNARAKGKCPFAHGMPQFSPDKGPTASPHHDREATSYEPPQHPYQSQHRDEQQRPQQPSQERPSRIEVMAELLKQAGLTMPPADKAGTAGDAHKTVPRQQQQPPLPMPGRAESTRLVITGPVFFGYSADEAAALLKLCKID